jgi:WD40 repeat protein
LIFKALLVSLTLLVTIGANNLAKSQINECISMWVHNVTISPDRKHFAAVWNSNEIIGNGNEIRLWAIENEKSIFTFRYTSNAYFLSVAFSPQGDKLAASGSLGTVVWNIKNGRILRVIPEVPFDTAEKPIFSPDGQYLMFVGYSGARLWSLANGLLVSHFPRDKNYSMDRIPLVSPDFKYILLQRSYDQQPSSWELWEIAPEKFLKTFSVFSPAFRSAPPILTAYDYEAERLALWNDPMQSPVLVPLVDETGSWQVSDGGKIILMQTGVASNDFVLWNRDTKETLLAVNPVTSIYNASPETYDKNGYSGQVAWYLLKSDGKSFITFNRTHYTSSNVAVGVIDVWASNSDVPVTTFRVNIGIGQFYLVNDDLIGYSVDYIERYSLKTGTRLYRYC